MKTNEFRLNLVLEYLNELKLTIDIQDYFAGRTILVTGGVGAIGSNLVIALSTLVGDDGMIIIIDNYYY